MKLPGAPPLVLDRRFAPEALLESAACRDMDVSLFFPDKMIDAEYAKDVCARCDVRILCLNYAIHNNEKYGVWGGMGPRERRRLVRMAS